MYQEDGLAPRTSARRFFEVFKRHKILVLLPIVIALEVSVPLALKQPHKYMSSATLTLDWAPPHLSALDPNSNSGQSPAQSGQTFLQGLIQSSPSFLQSVGRSGGLADSLKSKGVPDSQLNAKIVQTLAPAFTTTVVNPVTLQISMTGTDPKVMQGTLDALETKYKDSFNTLVKAGAQRNVEYSNSLLDEASKPLKDANLAVTAWLATHPGATPSTDGQYSILLGQQSFQQTTYNTLKSAVSTANLALEKGTQDISWSDRPSDPIRLSQKKKIISTGVVGLFAGLLVSALVLALFTATDRGARRREDIEDELGLEVVGTVGDYPGSSRTATSSRRRRTS